MMKRFFFLCSQVYDIPARVDSVLTDVAEVVVAVPFSPLSFRIIAVGTATAIMMPKTIDRVILPVIGSRFLSDFIVRL
jgi:hypothetical protein